MRCVGRSIRSVAFAVSLGLAGTSFGSLAYADDSCAPAQSSGTTVSINLSDADTPAADLVCDAKCQVLIQQSGAHINIDPTRSTIDAKQALVAKEAGLDLSTLEPDLTTDVYKGLDTSADEAQDTSLGVQNWDHVTYKTDICSSSGRYRFNIMTDGSAANPAQEMTLMLSANLHSFLLRKELLRKLGYKIPPIKYLPHVKVTFPKTMIQIGKDPKTQQPIMQRLMDRVLLNWLPNAANLPTYHWCGMAQSALDVQKKTNKDYPCTAIPDSDVNGDPYTIELQDVILMQATPVYYDLAIGPPIQQIPGTSNTAPETLRVVRALALVYNLLDIPMSVNQFGWYAAQKDGAAISVHVPDQATFATTMDDALWMVRKIAKLSREDITEIVANSYYPDAVAKVIVEKLISRRDSLVSTFGVNAPSIDFDSKVSAPPDVKDGKVLKVNWPGYASDFAVGDQPSPLKGIQWYLLSEVQSNAMEALMGKINLSTPQINEQSDYTKHGETLEQGLIQKYLSTGTVQTTNLNAWFAPLLNGSVQISRDVVFGQYLGTSSLVQLADTFGFTMQAGFMMGVDGLAATPLSLSGTVQGTASISLTHLHPLTSMKDGATQPLQNEIVAWIFRDASLAFNKIANDPKAPSNAGLQDPEAVAVNNQLAADVQKLSKFLAPGDSLILQESIAADETVSAGLAPTNWTSHHNLMPSLGPSVDMNETVLSRIHFFRKPEPDSNTLVIYDDGGEMIGPTASLEFTLGSVAEFPIISITGKKEMGKATTKVITLNINPNGQENPGIYQVAGGLASALRTGSTKVLENQCHAAGMIGQGTCVPEQKVAVDFSDSSSNLQFLHWIHRRVKLNGTYDVTLQDGNESRYMTVTDGSQNGASYQSLATQAASYFVQRLAQSSNYAIDTQANPNPGQTSSVTRRHATPWFRVDSMPVDFENPLCPYPVPLGRLGFVLQECGGPRDRADG